MPDKDEKPWRSILATCEDDAETQQAALIASGKASKEDNFMHILLVGASAEPEAMA